MQVVEGLLKFWPKVHSPKEVCYVHSLFVFALWRSVLFFSSKYVDMVISLFKYILLKSIKTNRIHV